MRYRNCDKKDLEEALKRINDRFYDGNVEFRYLDEKKKSFTIKVKSSRGPGALIRSNPFTGRTRHVPAACWHVHGNFFGALFEIKPDAYLISWGRKVSKEEGNWKDWNKGSIMFPQNYSTLCDCR